MVGADVFHIGFRFPGQLWVLAGGKELSVLKDEPHQAAAEQSLLYGCLLVEHQRVEDVVLVDAAPVVGAALHLPVVEHAVGQIVDAAVGQKLEGEHIVDDLHAAGVGVDALQSHVAQHQGVGMDIQKTPVLFGGQAAGAQRLLDGFGLAGALPIITAVVAAAHIFVFGVGVQNVRLLL